MGKRKKKGSNGYETIIICLFLFGLAAGIFKTYRTIIYIIIGIFVLGIIGKIIDALGNVDADFDNMTGEQFENFCALLLKRNGWRRVRTTKSSGDHGIDILANKDGLEYAIQCKCYSKNVGNKAIQEAYSGKDIYKADIAVVMTNRQFTKQATYDAKKLGVELWGRDKLLYFKRNAKKGNKYLANRENLIIDSKMSDDRIVNEKEEAQSGLDKITAGTRHES